MSRIAAVALVAALLWLPRGALGAPPTSDSIAELYRSGAAHFAAGRFDDARAALESAWQAAPDEATRYLLARTFVKLNQCERALPLLRAVQLEKARPVAGEDVRATLDGAFRACGSSLEKEEEARQLVDRARERLAVKQYTAARRDAELAQTIAPGDRVLLWLAYAYEATGNCESALRLYRRVDVANLPDDEQAEAGERIEKGIKECDRPPHDMVLVPGGTFDMGSTRGDADEGPVHEVRLAPYFLDRTEVPVARFTRCVEAGVCSRESFLTNADKPYCNFGKVQREQFPMNCVDWQAASAYCAWVGKRLPTEAEWERAARGPDGRTYPWGEDAPTCGFAVMKGDADDGCGEDRTWEVASRPRGVSEYGIFDLAGNVWEWVQDWYDPDYYRESSPSSPTGPETGERRVMRGGSWLSDAAGRSLRSANRDHDLPTYRGNGVGFRCARTAPEP